MPPDKPSAIPLRLQLRKGHECPQTPGYSVFSMEMQPSPAFSTTALRPGRESTIPNRETFTKYDPSASLQLLRIIHSGRIVISIILVASAAAIIGCSAHAFRTYNSTNLSSEWFLPLWPQNLDLRPSIGIIVGGALIVLTSSLYLACAILPACSPRFFFLNLLFVGISLLGLVASVFATGFSAKIYSTTGADSPDTIQSWTCRWYEGATDNHVVQTNGTVSFGTSGVLSPPAGFGRLCLESHAAFDILVLTLILEVGAVGLSVATYWLERKLA